MQNFKTLRQPLMGELAMSRKKREREKKRKNAIYSGHLRARLQPRAAHALRSDQYKYLISQTILEYINYIITWALIRKIGIQKELFKRVKPGFWVSKEV